MNVVAFNENFSLYINDVKLIGEEKPLRHQRVIGIKQKLKHGSIATEILLEERDIFNLIEVLQNELNRIRK